MSEFMRRYQQHQILGDEELVEIFGRLKNSPEGTILTVDEAITEFAKDFIAETGGSVWWCHDCDTFSSLNRQCCSKVPRAALIYGGICTS